MTHSSHSPKVTKEVYDATVADLHQARLSAKERFEAAQQSGDVAASSQVLRELELKLTSWREFFQTIGPRQHLIYQFDIQIDCANNINQSSLILPAHVSRLRFLEQAQEVFKSEKDAPAVNPEVLEWWRKTAAYTRTSDTPTTIAVMAPVARGASRADQLRKLNQDNLEIALPEDLAVACVAYRLAHNSMFLDGCTVRTATGTFKQYYNHTLDRIEVGDYDAGSSHAAAAYLPRTQLRRP